MRFVFYVLQVACRICIDGSLVADLKEAFDDDTDQEETEGKVAALCRYILHKEDGKAEGKVPPIPYRFVALPVCQEVI